MNTNISIPLPAKTGVRVNIPDLTAWIGGMFRILATWNERHKSRMSMAATDLKTLSEFGISQVDVFIEVNKPFWEA